LLALGGLTKEVTLLFPLALAASERRGRLRLLLLAALLPTLIWSVYLHLRFGAPHGLLAALLQGPPLGGVVSRLSTEPGRLSALLFVALPAVGFLPLAASRSKGAARREAWILLLSCAFVLLLPPSVHEHVMGAARNSLGIAIGALLLLPLLGAAWRKAALISWILPTAIWLPPVLFWSPWGPSLKTLLGRLLGYA